MVVELASQNVFAGEELIKTLEREKVLVTAAVWYYYSERGTWQLLLELPELPGFMAGYQKVRKVIEKSNLPEDSLTIDDVEIAGHKNPRLESLRSGFSTAMTISGIRVRGNMVNGELLDDAYIYRLVKNPAVHYVG